jgi:hypothetical protein
MHPAYMPDPRRTTEDENEICRNRRNRRRHLPVSGDYERRAAVPVRGKGSKNTLNDQDRERKEANAHAAMELLNYIP